MIDWTAVGSSLVALFVGAGTAIAWWQSRAAKAARLEAEVAASGKDRTIADAEHTLYKLLAERLTAVESDLGKVRAELEQERKRGRELEVHIYHLENVMRGAGLDPPERRFVIG